MIYESPDAILENADWTKQTWDLPPYCSADFFACMPNVDLEDFRNLPIYKNAVAHGLIYDDEWVGDWVAHPAPKKPGPQFTYAKVQKGCGCSTGRVLLKGSSKMPPSKKWVMAHEAACAKKIKALFAKWLPKVERAIVARLRPAQKADLSILLRKAQSIEEVVQAVLAEIGIDGMSVGFIEEMTSELTDAFTAGGIMGLEAVGMANDQELMTLIPENAIAFAKDRAAELVGMKYDPESQTYVENPNPAFSITDTTREGIRDLTTKALEEGWSSQDLKKAILDEHFFSDSRAETIARTELAFASTQGNLKTWKDTGRVGGKRWVMSDQHPQDDECDDAEDEGAIGIDDIFEATGDDGPPAHPNCLCALVPVLASEMDDGEEEDTSASADTEKAHVDDAAHEAATTTLNPLRPQPSHKQRHAGNYKMGHLTVGGLDVTIENPAGSHRRPEWPALVGHYGYVKRTEGADGDHVDIFVKPGTLEDYAGPVFVIDQYVDGNFDEHKCMLGWKTEAEARTAYLTSYQPGWKGLGALTRFTLQGFKQWLQDGDTKSPVRGQSVD